MDSYTADLEIKAVNVQQRIISGYAAVHSNIDRVGDIIDPQASVKAVARIKDPKTEIPVFIGHQHSDLPIGHPVVLQATPHGLYTETYVYKGPAGDNLLAVAQDMHAHGHRLGMSIGYRTHDSRHEIAARRRVRRILDYGLKEYSFAANQTTANPEANSMDVKAMTESSDEAGGMLVPPDTKEGAMQYRVAERGGKYAVVCDADADGDADDNEPIGLYDDEATANAVVAALRRAAGTTDDDGDAAKTGGAEAAMDEEKAVWSTAEVNNLPDSSFLFIEPGGEKDSDGMTTPRSKRHFPYKDASGKIDLPHLRDAGDRIAQSTAPGVNKAALQARARRLLESAGGGEGKTVDEPEEWLTGSPIEIRALGYRLLDLSDQVAGELKAMAYLGEETKGYQRIRATNRDALSAVAAALTRLAEHAARIDAGEDGRARIAHLKAQLALTDV